MRQFMIAASGKHKSVGAFRRTPFLLALVNPYGHRHPQAQIQEAKGEVFAATFCTPGSAGSRCGLLWSSLDAIARLDCKDVPSVASQGLRRSEESTSILR